MSEQQLQELVHRHPGSTATPSHSGLITDFNQLSSVPGMNAGIMNTLQQETYLAPFHVMQVQMVGPKVGAELRNKASPGHTLCPGRHAGLHRIPL